MAPLSTKWVHSLQPVIGPPARPRTPFHFFDKLRRASYFWASTQRNRRFDCSTLHYQGASAVSSLLFFVNDFLDREDGTTAVEYAAVLSIIMVVGVASITALGGNFKKRDAPHSAARGIYRFPN